MGTHSLRLLVAAMLHWICVGERAGFRIGISHAEEPQLVLGYRFGVTALPFLLRAGARVEGTFHKIMQLAVEAVQS